MTIALVAAAKVGGANGGTTGSIDTTGASLLVIAATYGGSAPTVSDSKGNTWTALTEYSVTSGPRCRIYYAANPTVGSGHTFTISGTSSVSAIVASAWSGAATASPVDTSDGYNNASGTLGVVGSTGFTPSENNCLVISGIAHPSGTSGYAASSGWTLVESQPYVGGTNYGVGATYKVQTTAANIPNNQATSNWTGSVNWAAASAVFKAAAAADTLTITSPVQYKTFQRSSTTGSITITGSHTGATEDIEASFNGGAYATIATAVAAGSFSGTLSGQAQGQGTLTVRKKTTTAASATVSDVGIGDVFLVCGDSISEGRGTNAQSYTHATLKATKFTQADAWGNGNDGIDTGTSVGSHWPLLATQIMASQSVPVAFISAGTGSTDVAGSASTWAKPGTEYTVAAQQVTDSGVNSVKAVLMHLGPNAVVNASTLSKATYNAAIDTLAANWAADIAGAPKLHLGIFGEVSTGSPPDRAAALNNLRGAIIEALGDNANVKPGPCLIELDYSDGVHPKSDAELATVAKRWWVALSESLYSGSGGRGPRLSSASWNTARNQLTVVFDRALKTGLSHATACWAVSDNGSAMTVSSVAYHGSNAAALLVNTSAAASGPGGTTTVTFAGADTAVGQVVPLSADITMPSGAAIQIPAEPIYAAAVSESAAYTGTVDGLSFASALSTAAGTYTAPAYTGTVDGLTFASALATAAGNYTAPGAPAYNGTVDGLTFASALSTPAGAYTAPGDIPQLDAPIFDRSVIGLRARRIGQASA